MSENIKTGVITSSATSGVVLAISANPFVPLALAEN